jgi:hypothetical protein
MVVDSRPSASTGDRPQYPDLAEEIGEDPARYLHDPDMTTWARIRGITSERVLEAWFTVEEDLGPRRDVVKRLNQRRQELADDQRNGGT